MGDSLKPSRELEGQTQQERHMMVTLFDEAATKVRKKVRVSRDRSRKPRTPGGNRRAVGIALPQEHVTLKLSDRRIVSESGLVLF
jgi:hypothetical protein